MASAAGAQAVSPALLMAARIIEASFFGLGLAVAIFALSIALALAIAAIRRRLDRRFMRRRGHFKTRQSGVFFWPPLVRGDAQAGVVHYHHEVQP